MMQFLGRLWTYVRPYRFRLILGLACGVLIALTNVALVAVIRLVANTIFGGSAGSLDEQLAAAPGIFRLLIKKVIAHLPSIEGAPNWEMVVVVCLIPAVMLVRSVCTYLNVYLVNWASVRAVADLRARLFGHLQNLPLGFFSQANTGDLISRITSDTQILQTIIGNSLASLIRDPLTILFLFVVLLVKQPALTLVTLVVLPVCVVPISIYARKVRKSARAMQGHIADLTKLMHESFTGIRVIKAYNLETAVHARFKQTARKYINHAMRVIRANEIPGDSMEFLGSVGVALVFIFVIFSSSRATSTPGDFLSFIGSVFLMYQPIKSLIRSHNFIHQAHSASQHVFDLLSLPNTIVEPAAPVTLNAGNADIRFENVDFDYGDKPVLRGINLTVKAGQMVALVGSSGSGKTTLVNLLPRFFDPKNGVVRIGETDIRQVAVWQLRSQLALVTQETILFHETIRRNIALGHPDATDAEIEAAARHANAHEFIMQKPDGYNSVVGEKGVTLSGGQRQRIAIARAILKNAPILVLDEATSALDTESERVVQAELDKLMQGRTTLCIAHRLSTIQKADRIVVLKDGRIVESGAHAELIALGGVYRRLYELQFNG